MEGPAGGLKRDEGGGGAGKCGGGVDRDLEGDRDDGPAEGCVGGGGV